MEKLSNDLFKDFEKDKISKLNFICGGTSAAGWSTTVCSRTWFGIDNDDYEKCDCDLDDER